jgi:hypothetical protein
MSDMAFAWFARQNLAKGRPTLSCITTNDSPASKMVQAVYMQEALTLNSSSSQLHYQLDTPAKPQD